MTDREQLERLYHEMYAAMIKKDRETLMRIHDESFVLVHMTGMHQNRQVYIDCIMNGVLNYYSEQTESVTVSVQGDTARMIGHSRVTAAVFGGGRHTWRLALELTLKMTNGTWKFTHAAASTY